MYDKVSCTSVLFSQLLFFSSLHWDYTRRQSWAHQQHHQTRHQMKYWICNFFFFFYGHWIVLSYAIIKSTAFKSAESKRNVTTINIILPRQEKNGTAQIMVAASISYVFIVFCFKNYVFL